MIHLAFDRLLRLPVKYRQKVWFIDDNGVLQQGVVVDIEIHFLDSGDAVDIDYIVHPLTANGEESTAYFFSDYEMNKQFFTKKRMAKRLLRH